MKKLKAKHHSVVVCLASNTTTLYGRLTQEEILRNSILLPKLLDESETGTWYCAQQSRAHAVEKSYQRSACGVIRWDGESNVSMNERCVKTCARGVYCGVVKWVAKNILRY